MDESTIQLSLKEIRKLLAERDELAIKDPIGAAHIQSEIFRKFAILDWRLSSLSLTLPAWFRRKKLISEISKLRKEAKAEKADLKSMVIPPDIRSGGIPPESGAGDGSSSQREFHLFKNLVPELQEKVLSNLTYCPSSKLAVIEAIPDAEELMHWDSTFLKFAEAIKIFVKRDQLKPKYIKTLRKVHPHLRDYINQYFHSWLVSMDDRYYSPTTHEAELSSVAEDENGENPYLVKMALSLVGIPVDLHQLGQVGAAIWDCDLNIRRIAWNSFVTTNHYLTECLSLLPNLRRLRIRAGGFGEDGEEEYAEWHRIKESPLPKLGKLENLNLLRVDGKGEVLVVHRMLRQYGNGLRKLLVKSSGLEENTKHCCSRLTDLYVETHVWEPGTVVCKKLETFSTSPLTSIEICVKDNHRGNENERNEQISAIFNYGLASFQETLEYLIVDSERATSNPKWIPSELTFPKVRYLDLRNIRGDWLWLLKFPALEELRVFDGRLDPSAFRSKNVLDLSWSREGILNSSVWKLLPFLRLIRLLGSDYKPWIITRDQCRSFQQLITQ